MQKTREIANETFILKSFFSSGYYAEIIKMTGANFTRAPSFQAHENSIAYYTIIDHRKIKILKAFKQYQSPISTLPFDPNLFHTPTYFDGNWIWMTHQPLEIVKMNNSQTIQCFPSSTKLSLNFSPYVLTRQYKYFQALLNYLLLKENLK